jgi:hypothetical protein
MTELGTVNMRRRTGQGKRPLASSDAFSWAFPSRTFRTASDELPQTRHSTCWKTMVWWCKDAHALLTGARGRDRSGCGFAQRAASLNRCQP